MSKKLNEVLRSSGADPALTELVVVVADCCKEISALVRRGALGDALGSTEIENVQGEVQQKLDVISNDIMLERCAAARSVVAMASEEMDTIHPVRDADAAGGHLLLFDPLDGSSNIEVNVSIGTIFSVLPAPKATPPRPAAEADFMQAGRNQVCAGYVVYGPQTTLVFTLGQGVSAFTLDPETGDWVLTQTDIQVPKDTKEFAINASNRRHWAPSVLGYVEACLEGKTGPRGKDFNMRWIASMVADVHRIMMRGGVFLYPWDAREPDRAGKLRLMYEANPMSMLVEQAGGAAFDGFGRILDAQPTGLHQRISVMLGSKAEVEHIQALHG